MKKDAPLSKWLVGAPKWLWEMGVKDVRGSEVRPSRPSHSFPY